jgi:micrococcal nuclease
MLVLGVGGCSEVASCGPSRAWVTRIVDGDTIELSTGQLVRYLMVDSPEIDDERCFSANAAQFNRDLVLGKQIDLRYDVECNDRYGRLLAYVSVDEHEVNRLQVERGYACVLHIPPNGIDRREEFENLQSDARAQRRGLWGACPIHPCR